MLKTIYLLIFISFGPRLFALELATLKYPIKQIFTFVLEEKNQRLNNKIIFPVIKFKSKTTLKEFQEAISQQWGQIPTEFSNAYSLSKNTIFLDDELEYYKKYARCMDDSLAHELVHFVQANYQNFDLNDESLEWEAVDIQTKFRNNYCPILLPQDS